MMTLIDLHIGDKLRLCDFGNTPSEYRRRLLSLGVTCGVEALVLNIAPLGCPILLEIRGTALALRKAEVAELCWERL